MHLATAPRADTPPATKPAPLTPGAYLKARRCAEQLTVEELAARLATNPRTQVIDRAEWIALIEADEMPATFSTIAAIGAYVRIDLEVLADLDGIQAGMPLAPPKLCRCCAASPYFIIPQHLPWPEQDLCPVCGKFGPPHGCDGGPALSVEPLA